MASSSENPNNNGEKPLNIQPIVDEISILHQRIVEANHFIQRNEHSKMSHQLEKLRRELNYLHSGFSQFDTVGAEVCRELGLLKTNIDDVYKYMEVASLDESLFSDDQIQPKFRLLTNNITKLKILLPSIRHMPSQTTRTDRSLETSHEVYAQNRISQVYMRGRYGCSSIVKDFADVVEGLDNRARQLLVFFAVFPVGTTVRKRVLKNWWDGEGLLDLSSSKGDERADCIFEELMVRSLIEPVREKCRLVGFKMRPFIHFVVAMHAMESEFFDFDEPEMNPTVKLASSSSCSSGRGCLVKTAKGGSSLGKLIGAQDAELEHFRTLFNVNEPYPDFKLDLFLKLKRVKVLSLGMWQASEFGSHHIELESTEFFKGLKSMKKSLRLFGLRGISRVSELPDALCKLNNLRILDLNACHNLELLPEGIGSLKKLIYLDISSCYLLDSMPKGLALLIELRVLKGFLIADDTRNGSSSSSSSSSCDFVDLGGLKNLNKLSVNANRKDFPREDELATFRKFQLLKSLTISWGGRSILRNESSTQSGNATAPNPIDDRNEATDDEAKVMGISSSSNPGYVGDISAGDHIIEETKIAEEEEEGELSNTNIAEIIDAEVKPLEGHATDSFSSQHSSTIQQGDVVIAQPKAVERVSSRHEEVEGGGQRVEQTKPGGIQKMFSRLSTFTQPKELADQTPGGKFFKALQKLDLQCYPLEKAPKWLTRENMNNLKKLYIRGGHLCDLGEIHAHDDETWKVEILRLKFLHQLRIKWEDLQIMFPKLVYLENVNCTNLHSFPCDQDGLWVDRR